MSVIPAEQPRATATTANTADRQKRLTHQISIVVSTFLFAGLVAYPIYIILQKESKSVTITQPTLSTYRELSDSNLDMLTCTCSNPAISYNRFIQIQYTLHQVCNSNFVQSNWISHLAILTGSKFWADFRLTSSSSFQALSTFCNLIKNTIEDSLMQFYSNSYMSLYITSLSIFQTQIQGIISQFIFSTTNRFLLSLEMIMNTIQNNVLLSALRTNYLQMSNNSQIYSLPQTYGNCSCSTTSKCIIPSAIYSYPSPTIQSYIPGFYQGCYIIDALLQSNLQCLFNQTCLNNLQSYLDSPPSVPVTPLNSSILIQFSPNTSIHMLIKYLMVETWNSSITYDSYYDACQPMQCTYNIIAEKERIYVTTMLIGLIGGLIAILNFIIPRVVKFFVYLGLKSEPAVVRTMTVISRK